MKKVSVIVVAITIAALFVGCAHSDYTYASDYSYKNESSQDITIHSYYDATGGFKETPESKFVIPVGESHTLRFIAEGGFPAPFSWLESPQGKDYIIVSNGEKQFINTRSSATGEDKLFYQQNYEIIKDKKGSRTYQYVFTDKDFENAEPIKQ